MQEIANFPIQQPNLSITKKKCGKQDQRLWPGKTASALKKQKLYELRLKVTPALVWWINDLYT